MGVDLSTYRARIGRFYFCQGNPLQLKTLSVGKDGKNGSTLRFNVATLSMCVFVCWRIFEILLILDEKVTEWTSASWLDISDLHNVILSSASVSLYTYWAITEILFSMRDVKSQLPHIDHVQNPLRTQELSQKVLSIHMIICWMIIEMLLLMSGVESNPGPKTGKEKEKDDVLPSQSRQTDAENEQSSAILNRQIEKGPLQDAAQFSASKCSSTIPKLNQDTADNSSQSSFTEPRRDQDKTQYPSSSSSTTDASNVDDHKSDDREVPRNQINIAKPCHYSNKRKRYAQIQSLEEDPGAIVPSSSKYSKTGCDSVNSSQTVRGYDNLNKESSTGFVKTDKNMTATTSTGLVESENDMTAKRSRSFVDTETKNTIAATTSTSIVETEDNMTTSVSRETKTVTFPLLDIVAQKDNSTVDNPSNNVTAIQQIFNVARTTNTNVNFSVDFSNNAGPVQFGQTNVVTNSKDTDSSSSESDREIRSKSRRTKRYKREYIRSEELQNTIDNTSTLIDEHCSDKTFVSTTAVVKGYEILLKKNVLIYAGYGSIGKTKNALAILRYFRDESDIGKDYTIIKLHSFVQWNSLVSSSKKMLVFLDNIFNETDMNNSCLNQLDQFAEIIWSCVSKGNIKAVITTRQLVTPSDIKKFEKYKLFNKEHIVDLSSEEHTLTLKEKIEILRRHLRERNISIENPIQSSLSKDSSQLRKLINEEALKNYANTNPYLGYPYTCFLFCSKFFNLGIDFFKHPHYHLIRDIDMLATSENRVKNIQYCILVVTMLHNGRFECEVDQDAISEIASKFKFKSPTLPNVKCSLDALNNTLLCRTFGKSSVFEFKHGTILEATAVSYGNYFPNSMIKTCNLNFLCKLVRTESCCDVENQDRFMIIKKQQFRNMAERILKELDNGNILDIVFHPVLADNDFLEIFCETLESSGNQTLLCKKCKPPYVLYINDNFRFVDTFLDVCCLFGKNNIVKHITKFDIVTESALVLACSQGHNEIVEYIIDKRSDFSNDCKLKLCHNACISGNYDMVKILKRKFKQSFYEKSSSIDLPIISAATEKLENVVKLLVSFKANIPIYQCKRLYQTCYTNGWRDLSNHIKQLYNLSFGKFDSCETSNSHNEETRKSRIEGSSIPARKLKEKRLLYKGVIHKKLSGNCYKKRGPSVVRKFAKCGMISKIKQLVKSKIDSLNEWNLVNEKGDDGQSAILVAAEAKQKKIVKYLLDLANIDVTVSGNDGDTLLHYCARYNWVDITRHLFEHFKDQIENALNQRGLHGQTPIIVAASNNSKQVTKLLIDQNMLNITIEDDDNDTLLHKCAWNGWTHILRTCCKKFFQTDSERNQAFNKIGKNGLSVIMSAAVKKQKTYVAALLTYPNLDLNFAIKDHTAMAFFYYCILYGWNDILRICLKQNYVIHEKGSLSKFDMDDIIIPDKLVKSIILTAVCANDHKLVQYVFKRKEKDYEERGYANHFMQYCVKRNWLSIIKIAFKYLTQGTHCSLLNHKNKKGQNILLFSACYGRKTIVRELLQKPSDTLLIDNHENNLLYYCIEKRWMHLVKLIFETMPVPICQTHDCEQKKSSIEMIQSILDSEKIHLVLGLSFIQNSITFNVINNHGHNILCFRNARWCKFFNKIFSDYLYQFQSVHLFQYKKEQEEIGILVLATFKHLQTLKQIVEHFIMTEEVDIVLKDKCDSVLHVCAKYGWSDQCKLIFSQTRFMANIDNIVNHKGENGECVLLRGMRTMRLRALDEVEIDRVNVNRHLQNTVYELLQHDKTNFTVTDNDGYNILHYCAECGWKEILMQVLYRFDTKMRREMLNKCPSGGETVLLLAAHHKKIKIVQDLLCVAEVNLKVIGTDRNNILHVCAMYGWKYLIRKIFNCLVDKEDRELLLNSKGFEGNSVILTGAKSKQKDVVLELLSIEEVNIILIDNDGNNILYWCIKNEWNDVMEIILKKNLNSGVRSQLLNEANISGKNAILMAAQLKLKSLLQYLLTFPEVDITITDDEGNNIIHYCLEFIDEDIIRQILKCIDTKGSTNHVLSSTDCFGNNIFHHCARKGWSNIIKEILNQLCNFKTLKTSVLNKRGKDDRSVLLEAAVSGQKQTVLDLIMYAEVDFTVTDSDGNNILYLCARNLWFDVFIQILNAIFFDNQTRKILLNQKGKSGNNIVLAILEISQVLGTNSNSCNNFDDGTAKQIVIELLEYKELNVTETGNYGWNILHWCVKCRWRDIMTNMLNVKCDGSMRKTLLNQRDDNGRNVFIFRADDCYDTEDETRKQMVIDLLKYEELDITITDKDGWNILHWCAVHRWWDIMTNMLNVKCDDSMRKTLLNQRDDNGRNVLIFIVDYYDIEDETRKQMVIDLLKYEELDITITDKDGWNILHWCAVHRWWDIMTNILNVKCDDSMRKTLLNQRNDCGRNVFIFLAYYSYNDETGKQMVKDLLRYKELDITTTDKYGRNILHWCVKREWWDIMTHILNVKCDDSMRKTLLNQRDDNGRNVLIFRADYFGIEDETRKQMVKDLLKYKELDITTTDKDGWNILHWCVVHGWWDIMTHILNVKCDDSMRKTLLNQRDDNGRNVLIFRADYFGIEDETRKQMVKDLLKYKELDITTTDKDGWNILHWCVVHGWWDIMTHILNVKCDDSMRKTLLNQRDDNGRNVLIFRADYFGIEGEARKQMVIDLLKYKELDITTTYDGGLNILHWCVKCRWWDIMTNILNVKCDGSMRKTLLNQRDDYGRNVLIFIVDYYGIEGEARKQMVIDLLKYKELDITTTDKDGWDILHWCVKCRWWDIMTNILNVKCDGSMRKTLLNQRDDYGRNVLIFIAECYGIEGEARKQMVIDLLKYKELDITTTDKDGWDILHWCVKCRWWDIMTNILNVKCDGSMRKTLLNQRDDYGRNVLIFIVDYYDIEDETRKQQMVIDLLKYKEVDITTTDKYGRNILHWCVVHGWWDIMTNILNVKCDGSMRKTLLNQRDGSGRNVLIFIAECYGIEDETSKQMVIDLLKYKELDITTTDDDGLNILHWCIEYRWWDIMTNILNVKCDDSTRETLLNQKDAKCHNTILMKISSDCKIDENFIRKQIVFDILQHKELNTNSDGLNILHLCIRQGWTDIIVYILNKKCNTSSRKHMLNQVDPQGTNIFLKMAISELSIENWQNSAMKKDLLSYSELDTKITDNNQNNILHLCVICGRPDVLKELLEYIEIDLTDINKDGNSVLHMCAAAPNTHVIINHILHNKCSSITRNIVLNQQGSNKQSVILKTIVGPNKETVMDLLQFEEIDLTTTDENGSNILHYCMLYGCEDLIEYILINICDDISRTVLLKQRDSCGRNILMKIVMQYKGTTLQNLLKYDNMDLTIITDIDGNNVLHLLANNKFDNIIFHILDNKCDVKTRHILLNQKNLDGNTVLMTMAVDGRKHSVKIMLKFVLELNVHIVDGRSENILHKCASQEWTDIVTDTLDGIKCTDRTSVLNQRNYLGDSVIMHAARNKNKNLVLELLKYKEVDTSISDNTGNDLLSFCDDHGWEDTRKMIS